MYVGMYVYIYIYTCKCIYIYVYSLFGYKICPPTPALALESMTSLYVDIDSDKCTSSDDKCTSMY